MTKILMVCMGNICRSPTAYVVALQMARQSTHSAPLTFDSAGTHVGRGGQPMDARSRSVLEKHHYVPVTTRSRQVNLDDFETCDLILAMDTDNLAALQQQCPAQWHDKLRLLLSFAPDVGTLDIPDPYYGDMAGFERVLDLCKAGVKGVCISGCFMG